MTYNFFYDEAEHSKKITCSTIDCMNYYDSFITTIVGWTNQQYLDIEKKYKDFEARYEKREKKGELKSCTFNNKHLHHGFASVSDRVIEFYEDFLSLFNEQTIIYISAFSKIEYLVEQLFSGSQLLNNRQLYCDVIYSIVKAINVYRPEDVIRSVYSENIVLFNDKIRDFFNEQISRDLNNLKLKSREIHVYSVLKNMLPHLKMHCVETIDWSYSSSFVGFEQMLRFMDIGEYSLYIDREGSKSNTLKSALSIGLTNVEEKDSKECVGIRIADMLVGLTSKIMKSLNLSLRIGNAQATPKKKILEKDWFILNDRQLSLYKKLYALICGGSNQLCNCYAGIYCDDFVVFKTLLSFINNFECADDIKLDCAMLPEYFNGAVCESLEKHYCDYYR